MILLFNLNDYLGGGEVLLVRLARCFQGKGMETAVLCKKESYIAQELEKDNIKLFYWPIENDSYVYMSYGEKSRVSSFFEKSFNGIENLSAHTFCMRDVYNANYFFGKLNNGVNLYTGIYHPKDTNYICRKTLLHGRIRRCNEEMLLLYHKRRSLIVMNESNLNECLPGNNPKDFTIIPLPILNAKDVKPRAGFDKKNNRIRLLWIGRFVEFKATGIMNIIRFAEDNRDYTLDMIGYGPLESRMKKYIYDQDIKNVNILPPIRPGEIVKIARQYDIGYATGTSVLELAQSGMPVIISPMLDERYEEQYINRCVGVFGPASGYNVGEVGIGEEGTLKELDMTVSKVVESYKEYCSKSVKHLREFDIDRIGEKYLEVFSAGSLKAGEEQVRYPSPGIIKRVIRRIL